MVLLKLARRIDLLLTLPISGEFPYKITESSFIDKRTMLFLPSCESKDALLRWLTTILELKIQFLC